MRSVLVTLFIVVAGATAVHLGTNRLQDLRLAGPGDDTAGGVQVPTRWDFADAGRPPDRFAPARAPSARPEGTGAGAQGLGDWEFIGDTIELRGRTGSAAVYFLPIEHESSFSLTTDVQVVSHADGRQAVVYLGTRRAAPDTLTGTALRLFAGPDLPPSTGTSTCCGCPDRPGGGSTRIAVSHFLAHQKLTAVGCVGPIEDGTWHRVSLEVSASGLSVSVDGTPTFPEMIDVAAARGTVAVPLRLAGRYQQPYVAVQDGVARFRYLEVGPPAAIAPRTPPVDVAPRSRGVADTAALQEGGRTLAAGSVARMARDEESWWLRAMLYTLYTVLLLVCLYMARHYVFTFNRLFGRQRHPYLDIDTAEWPHVTVVIPAHNEETVIGNILEALLEVDYPAEKLRILPVNDRSDDRTGAIIDEIAAAHPGRRLTPFHRRHGPSGKAAVLRDATDLVDDDIILVFDADYSPGRGLIKQLVAPFFDPQVGAVMGRVVPCNAGRNLLTRMLDLERAGGYQVDQQARMNMRLVPQYGGTVGGVRRQALLSAGGWRTDSLAEDTDATMRLLLAGWKTVYQNRSECYEQVPETWRSRIRQLSRWARGHNQALARYGLPLLLSRRATFREKLDGLMVLNVYMMPPVLVLGWALALALWFLGVNTPGVFGVLLVVSYSSIGNSAIFSEIAAAAYLDGSRSRLRLLPFMLPCFILSAVVVTWALVQPVFSRSTNGAVVWHKTQRHGAVS
jgi:cellulose synthase/poly-beta-1,6-N-acetylglucosamine synthase-like glycosyltransferase